MHCPHCQRALDDVLTQLAAGRLLIRENVTIDIRSARSGRLLDRVLAHNKVVDTGLNLIRDWGDGTQGGITQGAVGTDATAAADAQTALLAEAYRTSVTSRTKIAFTITNRIFVPKGSANGNTLREAALFNANNIMLSRVTHDAIAKTIANTVTIAWTHTYARA